jgi:hypothetical protein
MERGEDLNQGERDTNGGEGRGERRAMLHSANQHAHRDGQQCG